MCRAIAAPVGVVAHNRVCKVDAPSSEHPMEHQRMRRRSLAGGLLLFLTTGTFLLRSSALPKKVVDFFDLK